MSLVEVHRQESVVTITLADEERRNVLSTQLVIELTAALDAADADPDVRVVVLTNRGRAFCAGADLSARSSATATSAPAQRLDELFGRFARSSKPYVGRIAGHCVAGGMGLAAAMDISVAADDTLFGFTEVRVGVAPAVISVVCLPKMRSGDARAAFLRGNRFPAAEAARLGLVNAAVPRDQLDAEVDAVVADLLASGPSAIAATKRVLAEVPGTPEAEAFRWANRFSGELFASDEAREGMAAYLEKRPPAWAQPWPPATPVESED
ncbi:MAG: Enoyl-CoA hydratase [uncultured Acidimicrobiales bacterium]|uniref:Enoyl-CoA hydratase n=1 Tax=uncultured Acidimicrobiales bacterium TaxID=310071 RepID=A0A6J4I6C6_9ACTN|nr:MAG: Enoyl-CoA hydratase [uncultured Acidimicrobiales bacterium]